MGITKMYSLKWNFFSTFTLNKFFLDLPAKNNAQIDEGKKNICALKI